MPRKRYKKKKRTCTRSLCHGNKRGQTIRWTPREFQALRDWERERKRYLG